MNYNGIILLCLYFTGSHHIELTVLSDPTAQQLEWRHPIGRKENTPIDHPIMVKSGLM
jgi:hypothetical protein